MPILNRPGFSGGSSPEPGDYLIQEAKRCDFHVSRWEFESCPIGRKGDAGLGARIAFTSGR